MSWINQDSAGNITNEVIEHCAKRTEAQRLTEPIGEFNQSFCDEWLPEGRSAHHQNVAGGTGRDFAQAIGVGQFAVRRQCQQGAVKPEDMAL